jgi:UDP-glucose 4-epimerase
MPPEPCSTSASPACSPSTEPVPPPDFLTGDVGSRVLVAQLDCTNRGAFIRLSERYKITGIVHLAASTPGHDVIAGIDAHLQAVLNALEAATRWRVQRVSIASTLGLYLGVTAVPFREDAPRPMTPVDPIPVLKWLDRQPPLRSGERSSLARSSASANTRPP